MKISLVGCGCGTESLTKRAQDAIKCAGELIGAPRLLAQFPDHKRKTAALSSSEICAAIQATDCEAVCVLFSGDSGFYSGARLLLPMLEGINCEILPGISSCQYFAAVLGEPWQEWRLCSAHGTDCDPVAEVCHGQKVFFLTGGKLGPAQLCEMLTDAGLGTLAVSVGEDLGAERERIRQGTAASLAKERFASLSVMLAEAAPRMGRRSPGLPDAMFLRAEGVPMTKQEVRAVALAELSVKEEDICWDIGTGTGSVAVELALQVKAVWGIEQREEALMIAARNRVKFGAWNLRLTKGTAPDVLHTIPRPDAVFIGGSDGQLESILRTVHEVNAQARICVSAVAAESMSCAMQTLRALGYEVDIRQISVSRGKKVHDLTMMLAQNPVFLILGTKT